MKGIRLQLRLPTAIFIFLGSYLPLSVILLAQDYDYAMLSRPVCWNPFAEGALCVLPLRNPTYSLGIFVVCFICFAVTLLVLWLAKAKRSIVIVDAKYVPTDLINYTLPYVVAFMAIEYHETGKFFGFLVFLAWMFWITYRSGQIILNPLLIAFGWRLYDISYTFPGDNTKQNGKALADGIIAPGDRPSYTTVQDVVIVRGPKEGEE